MKSDESMADAESEGAFICLRDVHLELTSHAGPVHILKGLTLDIDLGETMGIVGPSGSGKTSILMIMAGLEQATRGQVEVAATNFGSASEDELALIRGRDIGIVFQSFHLVPTMTALENVALPLEFSGMTEPFGRAKEVLCEVGLGHRLEHFPSQLSGGEQQRVALARATANRPRIILADEPTGNLDAASGETVVQMLFNLHKDRGATLVLVTHDRELADRCGRVVMLRDGLIVDETAVGAAA